MSVQSAKAPGAIIDEDAIAVLDRAAITVPFDTDLLRIPAAADMRRAIAGVVMLLERLDHGKLARKHNPISRLVGADVEARLQFELANERVLEAIGQLRSAAQNASRVRAKLTTAGQDVRTEQGRLEDVIDEGKQLLATASGDDFHRSRFERRLSNIMALHAANVLTLRQIALASEIISSLLDRFTDVETLLLPVWQRNAFALATAAGTGAKDAAREFSSANASLVDFLKHDVNKS